MDNILSEKLKLIISMAIFGTIGIAVKYIPYPSSVIALIRGLIGTVFLLIVRLCKKERFSASEIKKNMPLLIASGILIGANWICLFEAYNYTSVSVATVCYYMAPVFVMLASSIIFREAMTLKRVICMLVAICGIFMVSGAVETGFSGITGVLLGLAAAVMYAAVIILNKFIRGISVGERTVFQLGAAAIALLPYVLLTEDISSLEINAFIVIMLAVVSIIHTGIAYVLYFGSISRVPAQTVALFSYIDPIVAVVLSSVILREHMTLIVAIGVVLVLGATIVSEIKVVNRAK